MRNRDVLGSIYFTGLLRDEKMKTSWNRAWRTGGLMLQRPGFRHTERGTRSPGEAGSGDPERVLKGLSEKQQKTRPDT